MSKRFINKVIIDQNKVIKKRNDDVIELYDYLETRNFDNFPKIISKDERNIEYEYIEEKKYHEVTSGVEFIKTVSMLHYKTLFFKDVSKNKYRKIYDKLSNNIDYLKEYYEDMISEIEEEEYMSPSHYLFARNYTALDSSLVYAKKELKKWFNMVSNKSKERVCIIHNNLSLKHFIRGDKNYLISWDKYKVDTPVLDIYNFYKKEGFKLDFKYLMKVYSENIELLEEEKKLLYILISIPPKLINIKEEYLNTINIKEFYDYIYCGMGIVNENK
ncbi:MAG: hypothetical protein ACI32H_04470 [Bacilli bacterium]